MNVSSLGTAVVNHWRFPDLQISKKMGPIAQINQYMSVATPRWHSYWTCQKEHYSNSYTCVQLVWVTYIYIPVPNTWHKTLKGGRTYFGLGSRVCSLESWAGLTSKGPSFRTYFFCLDSTSLRFCPKWACGGDFIVITSHNTGLKIANLFILIMCIIA